MGCHSNRGNHQGRCSRGRHHAVHASSGWQLQTRGSALSLPKSVVALLRIYNELSVAIMGLSCSTQPHARPLSRHWPCLMSTVLCRPMQGRSAPQRCHMRKPAGGHAGREILLAVATVRAWQLTGWLHSCARAPASAACRPCGQVGLSSKHRLLSAGACFACSLARAQVAYSCQPLMYMSGKREVSWCHWVPVLCPAFAHSCSLLSGNLKHCFSGITSVAGWLIRINPAET